VGAFGLLLVKFVQRCWCALLLVNVLSRRCSVVICLGSRAECYHRIDKQKCMFAKMPSSFFTVFYFYLCSILRCIFFLLFSISILCLEAWDVCS
jgi:hypothetical protein